VVIDLPRDIKDVLVADPTIANAVIRSSRRAYLIGVKVGQTSVYFFDADGQQIARSTSFAGWPDGCRR
jgi:pilus assembly protein CpaC